MSKTEMIRRLRLGDVQKVLRQRYGHTLPDDDAGRVDLRELLMPISLGQEAGRKMENAIELWAPWMDAGEAGQLMDEINRLPLYLRKPKARDVGQRLRLTYQQRKAWGIRTITPFDLTDNELAERRKAHKQYLRWLRRRNAGALTRAEYLANSRTRNKPWEKEGMKHRTWYRKQAKQGGTGTVPIKLTKAGAQLVPLSKVSGESKRTAAKANKLKQERKTA
jgi:hypothetical protein